MKLAMVMVAIGAFSAFGAPAPAPAQTFSVNVEAGATPRAILEEAEQEAARIFAAAGIAIHWIDGGNANVTLHVAAQSDLAQPSLIPIHFSGLAGPHHAQVFAVRPHANGKIAAPVGTSVVIGRMIAHELGHTLGEHHAPHSIMNPTLDENGSCRDNRCRFTPEQGARLRAALQETP
jgi:hypothetical protein